MHHHGTRACTIVAHAHARMYHQGARAVVCRAFKENASFNTCARASGENQWKMLMIKTDRSINDWNRKEWCMRRRLSILNQKQKEVSVNIIMHTFGQSLVETLTKWNISRITGKSKKNMFDLIWFNLICLFICRNASFRQVWKAVRTKLRGSNERQH